MHKIQKFYPFLLKRNQFHFTSIFQHQKVEKIKNWLSYIISNHECTTTHSRMEKGVEVTHCLKKYVSILCEF